MQAASRRRRGVGRVLQDAGSSHGTAPPSPQLALDLRQTSRPASNCTDLKQRWHLAEGVHVAVAWAQRG